jgi:hypothetical protein
VAESRAAFEKQDSQTLRQNRLIQKQQMQAKQKKGGIKKSVDKAVVHMDLSKILEKQEEI